MRFISLVLPVLFILLWTNGEAQGQAGRYIPAPRIPSGGGGIPHIPFFHGSSSDDSIWIVVAIVIVLAVVGWCLGQAMGQKEEPARANTRQPNLPPREDLIISPDEVEEKARKTARLLEMLANGDDAFNPLRLRAFITATFNRVQQCWEARDYDPVRELLGPSLLAQHEELLRAMSHNHEINRIEDLLLRRLEFVHLWCPAEASLQEVTALITFEAKVSFVNERTGAFLRGSHKVIPYQEYWVFRRHGDAWRLVTIERSHESDRLIAANQVDGMTDLDRCNAEEGVSTL